MFVSLSIHFQLKLYLVLELQLNPVASSQIEESESLTSDRLAQIADADTEPIPVEFQKLISNPPEANTILTACKHIKLEHDSVYSPYEDSVQFVSREVEEPIEIKDSYEYFDEILNEKDSNATKKNDKKYNMERNAEVEADGGSLLDDLTPESSSAPKSGKYQNVVHLSAESCKPGGSLKSTDTTPDRSQPSQQMPDNIPHLKWNGKAVKSSENVIEDASDEDTSSPNTVICARIMAGKDLLSMALSKNVLSQNNSLFYSTQITNLLKNAHAQMPPPPPPTLPNNHNIKRIFLPWFKLIEFKYQRAINESQEDIETYSAYIKISVENRLVQINDLDYIQLLFGLDPITSTNILKLLRRHGAPYNFKANEKLNKDLYQNALILTLYKFFDMMTSHSSNVILEYRINAHNQLVATKIYQPENGPSRNLNMEEVLEPEITEAVKQLKKKNND